MGKSQCCIILGFFSSMPESLSIISLHNVFEYSDNLFMLEQKPALETMGVFHLPRNSGNSGWDVNGTHVFGSFHRKISGINGTSEKVVLFSRWKLSDGNMCSIYNF